MPTYEYVCSKCDHVFDVVQPMSAKALETCPKENCPQKKWGKGKVKRCIGGGAGRIFKGSGFYITDYRGKEYGDAAKKDSAPATDAKSTGAKDSSPASESKASEPKS